MGGGSVGEGSAAGEGAEKTMIVKRVERAEGSCREVRAGRGDLKGGGSVSVRGAKRAGGGPRDAHLMEAQTCPVFSAEWWRSRGQKNGNIFGVRIRPRFGNEKTASFWVPKNGRVFGAEKRPRFWDQN